MVLTAWDAEGPLTFTRRTTTRARGLSSARQTRSWAALMDRVFDLDVLAGPGCACRLRAIATVQDPAGAHPILNHPSRANVPDRPAPPRSRSPPLRPGPRRSAASHPTPGAPALCSRLDLLDFHASGGQRLHLPPPEAAPSSGRLTAAEQARDLKAAMLGSSVTARQRGSVGA
jgi:hypothetical protein